ncbi:MAG: hypothetical protein QRY74_03275 [Chlamydia sp.]
MKKIGVGVAGRAEKKPWPYFLIGMIELYHASCFVAYRLFVGSPFFL